MNTQDLPTQPFFRTPEQRTALAREQFFEEGLRPSGLVSEAVIQSWDRSRQQGHRSDKVPALEPVGRSALSAALARNEDLIQAARLELDQLQASLGGTHCRVLLTDGRGVIVHISQHAQGRDQTVLDKASRLGVNLVENRLATTAPGIVVQTGQPSNVQAGEHFYSMFRGLRCAAAPIRDIHGQLAGVLDLSTEGRDFGFDAAAVVGMFATTISNRLLMAQSRELLVLHFQTASSLLNTPMGGLLGVDTHGKVIWINRVGHSLLGASQATVSMHVDDVLGMSLQELVGLSRADRPHLVHLPSGLGIWARATMQNIGSVERHTPLHRMGDETEQQPDPALPPACVLTPTASLAAQRDATDAAASSSTTSAQEHETASLAESQRRLIRETLKAQHGNVAKTARLLGVSRGLVYRHMPRATSEVPG